MYPRSRAARKLTPPPLGVQQFYRAVVVHAGYGDAHLAGSSSVGTWLSGLGLEKLTFCAIATECWSLK